jgi:hypothetical protein
MSAGPVPRSRNNKTKLETADASATRPKSAGFSKRESTTMLSNWTPTFESCIAPIQRAFVAADIDVLVQEVSNVVT